MNRETLIAKLKSLEREAALLAATPYSQSDPGAVMDRRFVDRKIRDTQKQLEELNRPPACKECTAACTPSPGPRATEPER